MGMLRVMSQHGDERVTWDAQSLAVGDPEAQAAVREAERIFHEQVKRGATAFHLDNGLAPVRITAFDQAAEQIVVVPRVVGG
jgi:hypothetical protein